MENVLLLSDEQLALQDTAAAFLAEFANARKPREDDAALWRRIAELGWAAVQVPEAFDGLGMGAVELALLMEEMGRRLIRSPFFASVVLAQTALIEAADASAQARWLPSLASGEATATLILAPGLVWAPDTLTVDCRRDGDGWRMTGEAAQVLDDGSAAMAFVAARLEGGGVGLFHVPADVVGLERTPLDVWDLTRPQAAWTFRDVRLPDDARIDVPGAIDAGMTRTVALAALQLAAEQVGGAAACLEMTVAYTKERVQFGKPVASFQAIKHRCAEMMVRIETARSAVRGVAATVASLQDADALAREVAVARVLAAEAYRFCAQEAVQLHGGVGFTWEYDPQLHFKRAQWGSQWFGAASHWRERVATHLLDFA
ncbi:acyl-CoA dehydrogenase family protein [Aromatoleum anaerobium]|uniref:Acyl-CoA dehydrogenase n=1 Tax=Aromatoleum anaerobium TaxID=182180 RepID=A0ABX1PL59_9RHOO|nr:acyl-CoA dehydrogenase family protein [Aromatoleum anaerobium]MCK0508177.1 acyl-CoA/acyl-ACP dehydrogenase [Aromatoleum anaerobium]